MRCEFHLQDPTCPDTVYLFEAIIQAAKEAISGRGMFAFVSRAGVDSLLGDNEMKDFLSRAALSLLVGIDAVTTRDTLVRLRELETEHTRLTVRVFQNPTNALFHPKVARFQYQDGGQALIIGSGNLTPGGLRQNFEAFSVIRAQAHESWDLSSWDRFFRDHAREIRAIDQDALDRASRNVITGRRKSIDLGLPPRTRLLGREVGEETPGAEVPPVSGSSTRCLVAQVPKAGSRWHQVHFSRDVIEQFFRVKPNSTQRVYLTEYDQDGTAGEQEVRPCVYSLSNKNHKIEIASHAGAAYPEAGPPIAVYRELQVRSFAYMLLLPGESGYDEMLALTNTLPNLGKGNPRVVTDGERIRAAWATCPLMAAIKG